MVEPGFGHFDRIVLVQDACSELSRTAEWSLLGKSWLRGLAPDLLRSFTVIRQMLGVMQTLKQSMELGFR
eukprot:12915421-Prorocentrum_lima.AAC.1